MPPYLIEWIRPIPRICQNTDAQLFTSCLVLRRIIMPKPLRWSETFPLSMPHPSRVKIVAHPTSHIYQRSMPNPFPFGKTTALHPIQLQVYWRPSLHNLVRVALGLVFCLSTLYWCLAFVHHQSSLFLWSSKSRFGPRDPLVSFLSFPHLSNILILRSSCYVSKYCSTLTMHRSHNYETKTSHG